MDQNKALVQAIVDRMKTVIGVSKDVDLADYLGGSRSGPAVWKLRGRIPVTEAIVIAEKKGVSLDWLILGRGSPEPLDEVGVVVHGPTETRPQEGYVDVPCFDMASFPDTQKPPLVWWSVPAEWMEKEGLSTDNTIVVRAFGDPMAPTILDGQVVVVDRRRRGLDGVFLVRFGEQLRIKRLQYMVDGTVRLKNDNRAYSDDVVSDMSGFEVIGYCHATFGRVR